MNFQTEVFTKAKCFKFRMLMEISLKLSKSEKDTAFRNGATAPSTKDSGKTTKHAGKALSGMLRATYISVNLKMTKLMDLESILMLTEVNTQVSG
jgi:hypothetical protein